MSDSEREPGSRLRRVRFHEPVRNQISMRIIDLDGLIDEDHPVRAVWEFAKQSGLTIVSKDADFRQLSFLFGHPPKTVWLRIGNSPTVVAADLLRSSFATVAAFLDDTESALLVLPMID